MRSKMMLANNRALISFVVFLVLIDRIQGYAWPTMMQKLAQEKDLAQFFALIQGNKEAKSALMSRELTIFAPTNAAFEAYSGSLTEELVLYHLVPMARTTQNLIETNLDSIIEQYPPIWINTDGTNIYVNNALLMKNSSDYLIRSRTDYYGRTQVLHVIDEVLTPMSKTTTSPTAYDFLAQASSWHLIPYTYNIFYKKILLNKLQYTFKGDRRNTYFIPADQFMNRNAPSQIDRDLIENSMISNRVIFTRSAYEDFAYVTRGVDRDFYNTVEFLGERVVRVSRISKRTSKKVHEKLVQLLQANVPVRNGVVHVVKDVLGLFERKLTKFPYLPVLSKMETDPQLNITERLFEKTGLYRMLESDKTNYTLFLPTDLAWKRLAAAKSFNTTELDTPEFKKRAQKLLRRHFVIGEYYDLSRLLDLSENLRSREIVLDVGFQSIMVRVKERRGKYYLRWGYKEVTISRPDFECTNGVIHLIDYPLIFHSELKGIGSDDPYNSMLYNAWNVIRKAMH